MGMYPNMVNPIPFKKHKSKHPIGTATQEKNPEKNAEIEQKKEENNENNAAESQNQMQEEPKQE